MGAQCSAAGADHEISCLGRDADVDGNDLRGRLDEIAICQTALREPT